MAEEKISKPDYSQLWLRICRRELADAVARGRDENHDREQPAA